MKLNEAGLQNKQPWINAGYQLPKFDREAVKKKTLESPAWIHFGAGNIFRAFQANVMQQLLNNGEAETGLLVAEGFDYEIIEKLNRKVDDYSILVTLKADGTVEKTVVGSIVGSYVLDRDNDQDFSALKEIFRNPALQMASFTITEKGYALKDPEGNVFPAVLRDFEEGPGKASSYLGKVVSLLYERFTAGELPIAMVSMDNCSHNGDKVYEAVNGFARAWEERGLVTSDFVRYVNDRGKVSYPWSMIDKITPRPNEKITRILEADGVEDLDLIVTGRKTFLSEFVNAEESQYLVIEDWFPNGHPPLEKGGVIFTDRETVDKVEKMKVCTCLNPVHTALAVFGCLLGYELIADEMKDAELTERLRAAESYAAAKEVFLLHEEASKHLHTMGTLAKMLSIRFGETIKAYLRTDPAKVEKLEAIPLVFAGWIRYLLGVDDAGKKFEPSADPLLPYLQSHVEGIHLGENRNLEEKIRPLLENETIFGVNLYDAGLADKVIGYLKEMLLAEGAVRRTLSRVIGE